MCFLHHFIRFWCVGDGELVLDVFFRKKSSNSCEMRSELLSVLISVGFLPNLFFAAILPFISLLTSFFELNNLIMRKVLNEFREISRFCLSHNPLVMRNDAKCLKTKLSKSKFSENPSGMTDIICVITNWAQSGSIWTQFVLCICAMNMVNYSPQCETDIVSFCA